MRVLAFLSVLTILGGVTAKTVIHIIPANSTAIRYTTSGSSGPTPVTFDSKVLCHQTGTTFNISSARVLPAKTVVTYNFNGNSIFPILVSSKNNTSCAGRMRVGNDPSQALAQQPHSKDGNPVCDVPIGKQHITKNPSNITMVVQDCELSFAGFITTIDVPNGASGAERLSRAVAMLSAVLVLASFL
ncbi:hypothetical protein EXIGLDRAFT_707355 [Exidia glandulosa HHB12029]|uniref:Uncharacterized protein n=1 Tax=Exidia glandulosa HHB12029 TaxID=1314781 RepID=A0A166NK63_EXIGL|nr:hypothetical protein EXIGLDRAFT_707355 [Exidia glandulosa HHB12029]